MLATSMFAQTNADSLKSTPPVKSVVVQQLDSTDVTRIYDIEKSLSSFCNYNRRSQFLYILSASLSAAGILFAKDKNYSGAGIFLITGGVAGIAGTVVYINSFKFLNFKPRKKEFKGMTYF